MAGRLILAPWEWDDSDPDFAYWRPPATATACLDLRTVTAAATPGPTASGLGLFAVTTLPPVVAADLGDDPLAAMTPRQRRALEDALAFGRGQIGGTTLAEALAEHVLGERADPTGMMRTKPLRMNRDGCALDLKGFGRIYDHRLDQAHPCYTKTLAVRRLDYERLRLLALARAQRKGNDPDRALDPIRRWTGYCQRALGASLEELLPASRLPDGSLTPRTTLTETWPTNGTTISTGQDEPWNEDTGDVEVSGNQLQGVTSATNHLARCTTDLSSDDHSHDATGGISTDTASWAGVTCRKIDSTVRTAYLAVGRRSLDWRRLYKHVSGTPTLLDSNDADPGASFGVYVEADGSAISGTVAGAAVSATDTDITGNLQCGVDLNFGSGGAANPTLDDHTMQDLVQIVSVGLATETDTALAVSVAKDVTVGLSTETDTALAVSSAKSDAVGLASETDTALAVTSSSGTPVGLATETDTAFGVAVAKLLAVGLASETDTGLTVTAVRTIGIGLASETDTALAVSLLRTYALGLATETDTALAVSVAKALAVGLATETDTAFAVSVSVPAAYVALFPPNITTAEPRTWRTSVARQWRTDSERTWRTDG